MQGLAGKVVIISGAGSGLGRESAIELAKEGSEHKMSGINKEHFALPFGRLLKARGHLLGEELKLELFIDLARQRRALFQGHAQALHRAAALAFGKAYAGELLDALHRHLGVGHRCGGEGTLQALPEGLQTAGGTVAAVFEHTFKTALLILQQVGAQEYRSCRYKMEAQRMAQRNWTEARNVDERFA